MAEFPAPLTPPESDLQDFPFMPLQVARLRDSDLAGEEKPEACWYAVLLWAAAWHQLPAGSLPDNDAVLTRLIGLGRDVRTFRRHKAAAMRGFVLCDDGRLYHPVVAEQVISAWNGKLQQRWRTECARIKKQNQRNDTDLPAPTFEEFIAGSPPAPGPENVPEDAAECPPGQSVQERETGTGTGRFKEPPNPPMGGGAGYSEIFEKAWQAYSAVGGSNHGREHSWAEWPTACVKAGGEAPLLGATQAHIAHLASKPGERVKAFHRWLRDGGFEAYLDRRPAVDATPWPGPPEIWAAVVSVMGERAAKSWFADTGWQEIPIRAVLSHSPTATKKLREDVGGLLDSMGIQLLERAA